MENLNELPQNLKNLLQEIGENSVLLHLTMSVTWGTKWRVFKNFIGKGHDIVLMKRAEGETNVEEIRIEVKTRQNKITKDTSRTFLQFNLTEHEWNNAHFLIALWFDKNDFFVVPISSLKRIGKEDAKNIQYRFVATFLKKENKYDEKTEQYLNNWESIKQSLL